jgi:aldose sugar dehydrogenase
VARVSPQWPAPDQMGTDAQLTMANRAWKAETMAGIRLVLAWHIIAAFALFTMPARVVLGEPSWAMAAAQLPAVVGLPLCYLLSGVLLTLTWQRAGWTRRARVVGSLVALAVPLSLFYLALLLYPGAWYSRWLLLSGSAGAAAFIVTPTLVPRRGLTAAASLLAVVGIGSALFSPSLPPASGVSTEVLLTSHGTVTVVRYAGFIAPAPRGGGVHTLDDGYVLATADGDLYRLVWMDGSDSLTVTRLPLHVPLNRDEFADAVSDVPSDLFRVADILVRAVGDSLQFLATHHHWHAERDCFVARVSSTVVARAELNANAFINRWRTLYETRPCLPIKRYSRGWPFAGAHIGGRLADLGGGRILVTVGDLEFDGWNADEALPQDTSADYGKTLIIEADGRGERLTMGHRNPQGLHIGSDGRMWSTEHGPQGGDLLHELIAGANYGWPYVTYGTEYGEPVWPLQGQRDWDDSRFRPAVFAWVPSIGISNLIQVQRGPVAEWRGDLLVASLEARSLFRVRLEAGRVVYVEPIRIGERIRDIVEGADGRIVLWTDRGSIISLNTTVSQSGAALFAQCAGCHTTGVEAVSGIAPSLHGIYGRNIAAAGDFNYSPALRSLSGRWSADNLDAFLANPQGFAPGTTMVIDPLHDDDARTALIEFLKTLR